VLGLWLRIEERKTRLKIFNVWGYKGWCWPPGSVMPRS
jgi:hypothetical protein